jgi:hypothetical protein
VNNPVTPKLRISHKFPSTKVPDLLSEAQSVFTDMGAAAATFTNPPVPLATLKQDIDNLTISAAAALDGGKKNIAQRNKDRHALEEDLTLLGAYALKVANGDPAILTLSGFMAAAPRARSVAQPLAQPTITSIDQGNSGQLIVSITAVDKAHGYDVVYSALVNGLPGNWSTVTVTQARKPVSITGLTVGTIYAFRVRALGKAGYTDYSDSATRMCI